MIASFVTWVTVFITVVLFFYASDWGSIMCFFSHTYWFKAYRSMHSSYRMPGILLFYASYHNICMSLGVCFAAWLTCMLLVPCERMYIWVCLCKFKRLGVLRVVRLLPVICISMHLERVRFFSVRSFLLVDVFRMPYTMRLLTLTHWRSPGTGMIIGEG